MINRTDAQSLIPEEVSQEILKNVMQESAALRFFPHVPMGTNQTRMPVLSVLPTAYWGEGDTYSMETSEVNWDNKYINVAELYCLVPIPRKLLADTSIDVWGQVQPNVQAVMAQTIDKAILLGTNKPSVWDAVAIAPEAVARNNKYTRGTNNAAAGGVAEDINQVFAKVEEDGFPVTNVITSITMKSRLRGARDSQGQKLLDISTGTYDGVPITYAMDGGWGSGTGAVELIAGDRRQALIGLRSDLEYRILQESTFFDSEGNVVLSLGQQDAVALKVTMRMGYQTANIINLQNTNAATRWPFAVLQAP